MNVIAALGIGGTNFHYAVGTERGNLLTEISTEPTDAEGLSKQVHEAVTTLHHRTGRRIDVVSIACKGLVDHERGIIRGMNMRDGSMTRDIDLRAAIDEHLNVPVYLDNDCTASALAEYQFGAGQNVDSIVHITMGTGIGAGVVDNDHLVRGASNFAAEIGTIQVGPPDGLEQFGIPGAWEAYCSGPGILRYVKHRLRDESSETALRDANPLTPQSIFDCAKRGDPVARDYLDAIAMYNARGCATVANLFDPGRITLGGGVAMNNYDYLIDGITTYLDGYLAAESPEFAPTGLGEDIAVYGALAQYAYLISNPSTDVLAGRSLDADD